MINNYKEQMEILKNLQPGQRVTYHVGFLPTAGVDCHEIREYAYNLHVNDRACLTQSTVDRIVYTKGSSGVVTDFHYHATGKVAEPNPVHVKFRNKYVDHIKYANMRGYK